MAKLVDLDSKWDRLLQGLMGMSEMESAVRCILISYREQRGQFGEDSPPFRNFHFGVGIFRGEGSLAGFGNLCLCGWLQHNSNYNDDFRCTTQLADRIIQRFPELETK